jgi:hypothetical protein
MIKQISVFVENQPGSLREITRTLADNGIDIRALCIADTKYFGVLRIVAIETERAVKVLEDAGITASITDVLAVAMNDKVGSFAEIVDTLSDNKVNIEYLYAFVSRTNGKAFVILRAEDNELAIKVLEDNNIPMITREEVKDI